MDYEADGEFTISFWATQEDCTGGIYAYLYHHWRRDVDRVECERAP